MCYPYSIIRERRTDSRTLLRGVLLKYGVLKVLPFPDGRGHYSLLHNLVCYSVWLSGTEIMGKRALWKICTETHILHNFQTFHIWQVWLPAGRLLDTVSTHGNWRQIQNRARRTSNSWRDLACESRLRSSTEVARHGYTATTSSVLNLSRDCCISWSVKLHHVTEVSRDDGCQKTGSLRPNS